VIGVGLAAALSQAVFVAGTNNVLTFVNWGIITAVLCLLRLLAFALRRAWRHPLRPGQTM